MDAVQHFEIPYKSHARAKKFFFDSFGWQLADVPGTGYTFAATVEVEKNGMPKRPGAINGGLTPRGPLSQAPTVLIRVGDIRSHVEKVRRAGGVILEEPFAMGPVIYARFRDPEGNILGLIEPVEGGGDATKAPTKRQAKARAASTQRATRPAKVATKSAKKTKRKKR